MGRRGITVSWSALPQSNHGMKDRAMHPLDNVIWNALTTRQAEFAESCGQARRFVPEVTLLGGISDPSVEGYDSLRGLLAGRGTVALFLDQPYQARNGLELAGSAPLLQMVCENGNARAAAIDSKTKLIELNVADSAEMIELTALTKPGPFSTRTHELGTYLGIRNAGKLVAMTGERLKVPGYTEVSAVCTHPEHTGRGYAGVLMTEVMQRIRSRGETPFLHVREDNVRAIQVYERLGFRRRVVSHLAVLRKGEAK
ncbi:MAG: acetyltransferase, family [Candidatus Sulfotelmatobacter sp.]|nr:acetyltransferase, family [Candidatus Sulfotelmatobacter sp.]